MFGVKTNQRHSIACHKAFSIFFPSIFRVFFFLLLLLLFAHILPGLCNVKDDDDCHQNANEAVECFCIGATVEKFSFFSTTPPKNDSPKMTMAMGRHNSQANQQQSDPKQRYLWRLAISYTSIT